MAHLAHEADKLLTIYSLKERTSGRMTIASTYPSSIEKQALSVFVVFVFASDERDDLFEPRRVEITSGDGHSIFDDGSSDDLD